METIPIRYCFVLGNGSQDIIDLELDALTLELVGNRPESPPTWANLDFHMCPNCTLDSHTRKHCPLALNLVNIVKFFEGVISYDKIHLDVITEERVISQNTTSQKGLSSLMGFVMATSGCPHTAFLKPMARFHLPFASGEETVYRATTMYLLAQYFLKKEGREADLELEGLIKIYQDIQIVNNEVAKRLRASSETDSSVNAIIILDMYAKILPHFIEESLEEIRYLFAPFFTKKQHFSSMKQNRIHAG